MFNKFCIDTLYGLQNDLEHGLKGFYINNNNNIPNKLHSRYDGIIVVIGCHWW